MTNDKINWIALQVSRNRFLERHEAHVTVPAGRKLSGSFTNNNGGSPGQTYTNNNQGGAGQSFTNNNGPSTPATPAPAGAYLLAWLAKPCTF